MQAEYEAKLEAVALRKEDRPKVRDTPSPPGSGGLQAAVALPSESDPSIQGCVHASAALFLLPFMCYFLEFLMCTWG